MHARRRPGTPVLTARRVRVPLLCARQPEPTRRLFERATSLRLSSKKMKFLFSRYLTYARSQENTALVAHVRDKARAFVVAALATAEGSRWT